MISKELLSEVSGRSGVRVNINHNSRMNGIINIYELNHMCKEFILSQEMVLMINLYIGGDMQVSLELMGTCPSNKNENGWILKTFYDKSEQEAMYQACQWILDNKDKS